MKKRVADIIFDTLADIGVEQVNSFNVWKEWEQMQGADAIAVMGNSSWGAPGLSNECFGRYQLVFANINFRKGEISSEENLLTRRPGTRLSPMCCGRLVSSCARRDYDAGAGSHATSLDRWCTVQRKGND